MTDRRRRPPFNTERFARELGKELAAARKARGWTRRELRAKLLDLFGDQGGGDDGWLSPQTLASYELGTRNVTVVRFGEIAAALDVSAAAMVTRAAARTRGQTLAPSVVLVDLPALARSLDPRLRPLVAWASLRVKQAGCRAPQPVALGINILAGLLSDSHHTPESVMLGLEDLHLAQLERQDDRGSTHHG